MQMQLNEYGVCPMWMSFDTCADVPVGINAFIDWKRTIAETFMFACQTWKIWYHNWNFPSYFLLKSSFSFPVALGGRQWNLWGEGREIWTGRLLCLRGAVQQQHLGRACYSFGETKVAKRSSEEWRWWACTRCQHGCFRRGEQTFLSCTEILSCVVYEPFAWEKILEF